MRTLRRGQSPFCYDGTTSAWSEQARAPPSMSYGGEVLSTPTEYFAYRIASAKRADTIRWDMLGEAPTSMGSQNRPIAEYKLYGYGNPVKRMIAEQTVALWRQWMTLEDESGRANKLGRMVYEASLKIANRLFGVHRLEIDKRNNRQANLTPTAAANLQYVYELIPRGDKLGGEKTPAAQKTKRERVCRVPASRTDP